MTPAALQAFKADFFRALAHPIRIRILETLGDGERSVQELQAALRLDQPVVSQQLAVLRAKNIVTSRKIGTTVRYALSDPLITRLLSVAREIFTTLVDSQSMLQSSERSAEVVTLGDQAARCHWSCFESRNRGTLRYAGITRAARKWPSWMRH